MHFLVCHRTRKGRPPARGANTGRPAPSKTSPRMRGLQHPRPLSNPALSHRTPGRSCPSHLDGRGAAVQAVLGGRALQLGKLASQLSLGPSQRRCQLLHHLAHGGLGSRQGGLQLVAAATKGGGGRQVSVRPAACRCSHQGRGGGGGVRVMQAHRRAKPDKSPRLRWARWSRLTCHAPAGPWPRRPVESSCPAAAPAVAAPSGSAGMPPGHGLA